MINAKEIIRTALLNNAELIALLGGDRIYQLVAKQADEFPRITFFEIDNADAAFADDEAYASSISVQIDVWSRASTFAIANEVDKTMKELGFARTSGPDFYEQDTKIYHKALRYRGQFEGE